MSAIGVFVGRARGGWFLAGEFFGGLHRSPAFEAVQRVRRSFVLAFRRCQQELSR